MFEDTKTHATEHRSYDVHLCLSPLGPLNPPPPLSVLPFPIVTTLCITRIKTEAKAEVTFDLSVASFVYYQSNQHFPQLLSCLPHKQVLH